MRLSYILLALLTLAAVSARADTTHLKNGRVIVADAVREKNGQIEYEIGDNVVTIPRSAVALPGTAYTDHKGKEKDSRAQREGPREPARSVWRRYWSGLALRPGFPQCIKEKFPA